MTEVNVGKKNKKETKMTEKEKEEKFFSSHYFAHPVPLF